MQSLQPVLLYGRYEWDQVEQPLAEYHSRLEAVRELMHERGWLALIVLGDPRENSALCWLTNLVPNQRWGMALICGSAPVRIIASVHSRDLPAVKPLTWVEDVRADRDVKAQLIEWLADLCAANKGIRPAIGITGLAHMRSDIGASVMDICAGLGQAEDATSDLAELRREKSRHELDLIRRCHRILERSLVEVEQRRLDSWPIIATLIAGERCARGAGAQDVRILWSQGRTGYLKPLGCERETQLGRRWTLYFAVRYRGYWTAATLVLGEAAPHLQQAVRDALEIALRTVAPGVTARALETAMRPALSRFSSHPMLGRRVARAHDLSLDAAPWMTADTDTEFAANAAYLIVAGAADEDDSHLQSVSVLFDPDGHKIVSPIPAEMANSLSLLQGKRDGEESKVG